MKSTVFRMTAALLVAAGCYISLPTTGAVYQDTKTGTITIQVSVPQEVTVSIVPGPLPPLKEEPAEETSPVVSPTSGTNTPVTAQPSASQTPEESATSAIPTKEGEFSNVPTAP